MHATHLDPHHEVTLDLHLDPDLYVCQLALESLHHRAVRHPYLEALAAGTLPDIEWAMRDFARQYHGYSRAFPKYLTAVMSRLDSSAHRLALLDNLTEESGTYAAEELEELEEIGVEPSWVVGVPHPELFARFSRAMGVVPDPESEHTMVQVWRELFLATLTAGSPAEAVGALGLGTENIVSTIYRPFVAACEQLGTLSPRDSVFFTLHTAIDDDHQETLQRIAADFAVTERGRADLRRGMIKALVCRAAFWDWMLARAMDPARAEQL